MSYTIELGPEQEHALRILASAKSTTIDGVAKSLISKGLAELLTDETITKAFDRDRDRITRFLEPWRARPDA